jgi:hypothetical protein
MRLRNQIGPVVAAGLILALAGTARAFHEHGVASCDGCHVLHNSRDDLPVSIDAMGPGPWLLKFSSATELCLSCHAAANGEVMGPDPKNPPPERGAGNFAYLLENNINDAPDGLLHPIRGNHAGHSIVAPARGLAADPDHATAPGGVFRSTELGCVSCHDPHGNRNFRMLYGAGAVLEDGFAFIYAAPVGDGIALNSQESGTNHTAYRSGWSDWCANCHGNDPHRDLMPFQHPLDADLGGVGDAYNGYNGPDSPQGGQYATAYIPELPIEDPSMTISDTRGASGVSRISCLTCHRAHATSAPRSLRWDPNVTRLRDDGLVSGSYPIPSPYSGTEQRGLCIKCHYETTAEHGMQAPCMSCHRTR